MKAYTNMIKLWCVLLLFISRVTAGKFPPLDLHIGTGGEFLGAANLPLGAQTLYGTVRLGPDTSNSEDSPALINRYAGYHYYDNYINIFSHTHVFGAGIVDYGNVGILPVQVNNDNDLQNMISNKHGYRSTFEHKSEVVEPGYYQVYLNTHKTKVELTATEQVGVHRYSFDDFNEKHRVVLIDSSYALPPYACQQSHVNINSTNNEITGSIFFKGFLSRSFGGVTTYFVITFTNWTDFGVWTEGRLLQGETTAGGCSSGAYVKLPTNQQQVTIYVGISFVSIEQARVNLEIQTKLESFDSIRGWIQQKWLDEMSRFEVQADWNIESEIKFNTALVHSMSSPTIWDESNGVYLGFDGKIHTKPDYMDHVYTDLSIWDIFRTQVPFLILYDAKRANDIVHSIMLIVEQGGYLPKWPLANGPTNCMIGSHADIILSDLIMKREHDSHLNMTQVLEALRIVANTKQIHESRFDPPTYIKYGYVPFDMDEYSASLTLSYAYDDWAIGNVMHAAGLIDEAQEYYSRSQWFEHVFDNNTKFFCPRNSTGDILCPATEIEHLIPFDYRYTEGDAWHYRFFVPHNTSRLVDIFGGATYFAQELDTFFVRSRDWPTITIPNPYYWAGNEHNLFSVWQFHYANRSDLTQLHARWLLDNVYTVKPDGIPGNDDYGTMSAWYIFTSLGFYPLAGSSTYLIGSPAFDRITIRRNNDQCILTIIVHDNAKENIYVERVLLNGEILPTYPFIDHINHLQCSTDSSTVQLDFFMSSTPTFNYH
ncbi:unnamed protein product [Rotaria magnacalcarata]|uniref:Alpha-1,2-mannosidase n=1 Tax=Rotaria magnacalcarata TaxID=392030 RepID=A0A816WFF5_9BILA|nr:unnamed protein product [Rotaria magnacalcarata]CAF3780126.1 unnamed protein product [Rotaria magnacalcarata]